MSSGKLTVALAQISPVWLDREETVREGRPMDRQSG